MAERELPKPYSVTSLTAAIKRQLEGGFSKVYLEAEISGWRLYPSGHAYFTLKDEAAQISCVMFASAYQSCLRKHPGIETQLKDGARIVAYGNVSVYAPRGQYQLVVLAAKLVGEGDLMQRYLELKAKLEAEGLFDPAKKRPLPFLPRRIGIVTSEAGAVIHDMATVLTRRFPDLQIRLYPTLVQGADAPRTIVAGIRYFNSGAWPADLLIVARGGGSFEDLFCFNDESVVRAVAASQVPTISAVGHETDVTLCDFAADRRAGTPSIAAEIAVQLEDELVRRIADSLGRLTLALRGRYEWCAQRTDQLSDALAKSLATAAARAETRLERVRPRLAAALSSASSRAEMRLERLSPRLLSVLNASLAKAETRLAALAAKLDALSPYATLSRGYSLTTDAKGRVVKDAAALKRGDRVSTRLAAGSFDSEVV